MGTGPVIRGDRLGSLDVLRGVAVCGILLMNIAMMGMLGDMTRPPLPAVLDADWITYLGVRTFLSGTMRGLFTLLFGAGMLIMLRRADEIGGEGSIQAYLTRCFALILLGAANFAIFLWPGEILFNYGVVGIVLLLFRRADMRLLLIAAAASLLILNVGLYLPNAVRGGVLLEAPAAAAAKAAGTPLSEKQEAALELQAKLAKAARPPSEKLALERAQRTSYPEVVAWSAVKWSEINLSTKGFFWLFETLAFMLIGMALFRSGVLSGEKSLTFYWGLAAAGYGLGLAIRCGFMFTQWKAGFEPNPGMLIGTGLIFEQGRLPATLGLVGLVIALYKKGAFGKLAIGLTAIGRLALTNYVGQSVIAAALFYGLGYVGRFGFAQLMGIAVCIWVFQGVFSVLWLRFYEMGLLEWLLRNLTYGKWLPLKRLPQGVGVAAAQPAE